ncbi:MAG: pentapeptide repeat-containing protein [Cyanobacteria bacterium P01_D01_bin.156]
MDEEQLDRLWQGVKSWNSWREKKSNIKPNLRGANLKGCNLRGVHLNNADLTGANLSTTCLNEANLRGANLCVAHLHKTDLNGADLSKADLSVVDLSFANLVNADLSGARLPHANLISTNLRTANLSNVNLRHANLLSADLSNVDLSGANLIGVNLSGVNLSGANLLGVDLSGLELIKVTLSGANLCRVKVLGTNFEKSVFTGACLEDWHINSETRLEDAICEYIYLESGNQNRRPRAGVFKPGEFSALYQQVVDTVDLIFKDGIDWQAFFQSFQDLRSQYTDQDISIQGIEKKRDEAFVVRLEVIEGTDKAKIESSAKEIYGTKLALLEQRYRAELQAKDSTIVAYREQSANLMKITELLGSKIMPSEINQTFNAPVANAAVTNHGTMSAIQNNYGPNTENITRLLTTLRDQAQTFPTGQKDDVNDALDLLEPELKAEQPDQNRISRQLKKLIALGTLITGLASGAAAVSGDVSTFTDNVIELTEKLGIPIEQVQLPPSGTP